MIERPTLSVVIPTAGLERVWMLARCIESIQRCVRPCEQLEIIVVLDGGEPDDYSHELRDVDPTFHVVAQRHAGPATARNTGWRASAGEIVAFIDDDTVAGDEWVADLQSFFHRHPDVAGVGGLVEPIRPRNVVNRMMRDMGHLNHRRGPFGWRLITANAAFRRSALEAVGGFDERFTEAAAEDFDLCDRLGRAGYEIRAIPGALVYHHHPRTVGEMLATASRYRSAQPMLASDEPLSQQPAPTKPPPPYIYRFVRNYLRARRRSLVRRLLALDVPPRGVTAVERMVYGVPYVRRMPMWYRKARRSCPNALYAVGETMLELVWQTEFARPGAAPESDPTNGIAT